MISPQLTITHTSSFCAQVADPDDLEAWRQHMQAKPSGFDLSAAPPALHVRYYYPEPEVMLKAYDKWVEEWATSVDLSIGKPLFTHDTMKLVERTKEAIALWWYSGEHQLQQITRCTTPYCCRTARELHTGSSQHQHTAPHTAQHQHTAPTLHNTSQHTAAHSAQHKHTAPHTAQPQHTAPHTAQHQHTPCTTALHFQLPPLHTALAPEHPCTPAHSSPCMSPTHITALTRAHCLTPETHVQQHPASLPCCC